MKRLIFAVLGTVMVALLLNLRLVPTILEKIAAAKPAAPTIHAESARALADAFAKGGAVMMTRKFTNGTSTELVVTKFNLHQQEGKTYLLLIQGPGWWCAGGTVAPDSEVAVFDDVRHDWKSAELGDDKPLQITLDNGDVITGHEIK